ncbi:MAG: hypothetical protein HYT31_02295 [Parcubacteria group bacterium]|nr:hypothetical protein [Parcubacteria group bacterium]
MNNTAPQNKPPAIPEAAAPEITARAQSVRPGEGPARSTAARPQALPKPKLAGFMAQWFRQYYKLVTIAACAMLLVAGYLFLLGPKFSAARVVAGSEFDEAAAERSQLEERLGYLQKLERARAVAPSDALRDIEDFLPSDPGTPQLLTSLEAIAASSGVLIDGIEFVIPEGEEAAKAASGLSLPSGVSFVEVALAVASSPYDALKALLANIEANLRLMDVIAVAYSPASKSYTITLRAYYLLSE